jgi:hypothetical protein
MFLPMPKIVLQVISTVLQHIVVLVQNPLFIGGFQPLLEYPGQGSRLYAIDDILDLLRTGYFAYPELGFQIAPLGLSPHVPLEVQQRRMQEVKDRQGALERVCYGIFVAVAGLPTVRQLLRRLVQIPDKGFQYSPSHALFFGTFLHLELLMGPGDLLTLYFNPRTLSLNRDPCN